MLRSLIRGIRCVCRVVARVVIVVGVVGLMLWAVSGWMWVSSRWMGKTGSDGWGVMASQGTLSVGAGGAESILEESGLAGGVLAGRRPAWKWWTYWAVGEPLVAPIRNMRLPGAPGRVSAAPTASAMTSGKPGSWFVQGSMALPAAGLVVLGLVLRWVGAPRSVKGKCSQCGYDLRGLGSGRCPECGTVGDGDAGAASVELSALELKKALRKRVAGVLSAMTPEMVRGESERACVRAVEGGMFPVGAMVMVYAPIAGVAEVDLSWLAEELARRGCRICVPRLDGATKRMSAVAVKNLTADLVPDAASRLKGMRMPRPDSPELSPGEIDVVVVPGVAFDRAGGRLGRGMGYYDRFLAGLEREGGGRPRRVAIVFDGQVLAAGESVPMEAHDERVDVIVTPTEVIAVGA